MLAISNNGMFLNDEVSMYDVFSGQSVSFRLPFGMSVPMAEIKTKAPTSGKESIKYIEVNSDMFKAFEKVIKDIKRLMDKEHQNEDLIENVIKNSPADYLEYLKVKHVFFFNIYISDLKQIQDDIIKVKKGFNKLMQKAAILVAFQEV